MSIITVPFSWLLMKFYDVFGSYGVSIILFALIVNLIMTPFMAQSKKSMLRTARLQPRLKELEARHAGNPQKYQQELSKLYQEEHINPMSGCLWSFIPLLILIPLYSVIRQPLTHMMGLTSDEVSLVQTTLENMNLLDVSELGARAKQYLEITMAQLCHENYAELSAVVPALKDISYTFLGLNLGSTPRLAFWIGADFSRLSGWLPAFGLFLIPIISALLSWASMKISMKMNPSTAAGPQADQMAATNKSMEIFMPLMSVWICFAMPAAMGVYWIANSIFGIIRDFVLTKIYRKKLLEEDTEWLERERKREEELEKKRKETERKREEGSTTVNKNTSKKKLQAAEKQKSDELKAAAIAADRAERRERLGIEENEVPASQVGGRRYARGRAYDPDRFGKQDEQPTAETPEAEA